MEILKVTRTTLTESESVKLRTWIGQTEGQHLKQIALSKVLENAVAATNKAMDSDPSNAYGEAAGLKLKEAQRYQTFLTVLQEIIDHKGLFEVVSIK